MHISTGKQKNWDWSYIDMTHKAKLTVVTYNIQFGINSEKIISNVEKLVHNGADVVCLQETINVVSQELIVTAILKRLGKKWQASYNIGTEYSRLSIGTCIFWNTDKLTIKREDKIFLPKLTRFAPHEKLYYWLIGVPGIPVQRRATICYFSFNNSTLRITSLHIDNVGGPIHRMKQLSYLLSEFKKDEIPEYEIICGDFNTFDLLKTGYERKLLQREFGKEFIDASKKAGWTSDIYNIDFKTSVNIFPWMIKTFHIHIRRRLDYLWVRNFTVINCKKVILPGSDHFPVFAELEI
jgi:endonuclease/exonuclease/phosphatase family metal-dependent hydrolase